MDAVEISLISQVSFLTVFSENLLEKVYLSICLRAWPDGGCFWFGDVFGKLLFQLVIREGKKSSSGDCDCGSKNKNNNKKT